MTWVGDHPTTQVHEYRDGVLVVKWDLVHWKPMAGRASRKVLALLRELAAEGKL